MSEKIFFEITEYYKNCDSIVSLTFDDDWIQSWVTLTNYVRDKNIPLTFYINTKDIKDDDKEFYRDIASQGHEIGYHTQNHNDMRDLTDDQILEDIIGWSNTVKDFYNVNDCLTMSYPYGYRPKNLKHIQDNFISGRSTMPGLNEATPKNIHRLKVKNIGKRSTLKSLNDSVDIAIKEKKIIVEAGHGLNKEGWSPIPEDVLFRHIDYLLSLNNIWVTTARDLSKYVILRDNLILTAELSKDKSGLHYELKFLKKDGFNFHFFPVELTIKIIGYRVLKSLSQSKKPLEWYKEGNNYFFHTKDFINPIRADFD